MLVLVCGSRSYDDVGAIRKRLTALPRGSTVIQGGARGADQLAAEVARQLGFNVVEIKPDWSLGRHAGHVRNIEMLERKPELVIAFWDGLSTGTKHTIDNAISRSIPVEVIE